MITTSVITAFAVALICTLVLPVVLLIVLGATKKISGLPLLAGAAAFFFSQIMLRIPILQTLAAEEWFQNFSAYFFPYVIMLSLTAGLFEETGRLVGAKLLKTRRTFRDVVSFGLGHGICEVIILIGFSHINNLILCLALNGKGFTWLIAGLTPDVLETLTAQFTAVTATDIYLGIMERVSAVLFHIFATTLVFQGVIKKKKRYYFLAVGAHTAFNLAATVCARYAGVVLTEFVLLALALAAGYYVLRSRTGFISAAAPADAAAKIAQ